MGPTGSRKPRLVALAACLLACASGASGAPPEPAPPEGVLAFVCEACAGTNTDEVFTVRADGTGLTRRGGACGEHADPDSPAWSPDGSSLVYACEFANASAIWTSPAGGSAGRPLTQLVRRTEQFDPEWSRDGRRLAWARFLWDSQSWRVVVARADGRGAQVLTKGFWPSWSRRGRVVFVRGGSLMTIAADGSGRRPLARRRSGIESPKWSPDGRSIAFTEPDRDGGTAIRLLGLGDYRIQTLVLTGVDPTSDLVSLAWSPDGHWLAYGIETDVPTDDPTAFNAGVELWALHLVDGTRHLVYADVANQIKGVSWTS